MAMTIAMRIVIRILVFTEVTPGQLPSAHYTHIKYTPKSRCVFRSGHEDTCTTNVTADSMATLLRDLADDRGG